MNCCYIIYSKKLDRYYTGISQDFSERILKHNAHTYGNHHYTAAVNDWELYFLIECESINIAVRIERHIKKMKSRVYIENLKKYPEMVERLKTKWTKQNDMLLR